MNQPILQLSWYAPDVSGSVRVCRVLRVVSQTDITPRAASARPRFGLSGEERPTRQAVTESLTVSPEPVRQSDLVVHFRSATAITPMQHGLSRVLAQVMN